jgi:prevent-host-death family protein
VPLFRPSVDVRPVTEFRAHASEVLEQVQTTKRPVVLTQHGRSAAVLLDVGLYESLVEEVALARDVRAAEEQLDAGMAVPHESAEDQLRERHLR